MNPDREIQLAQSPHYPSYHTLITINLPSQYVKPHHQHFVITDQSIHTTNINTAPIRIITNFQTHPLLTPQPTYHHGRLRTHDQQKNIPQNMDIHL